MPDVGRIDNGNLLLEQPKEHQVCMFHTARKFSQYLIVPAIEYITPIPWSQRHTGDITDGKFAVFTEPSPPPEDAALHDDPAPRRKAAVYCKVRWWVDRGKLFREQVVGIPDPKMQARFSDQNQRFYPYGSDIN